MLADLPRQGVFRAATDRRRDGVGGGRAPIAGGDHGRGTGKAADVSLRCAACYVRVRHAGRRAPAWDPSSRRRAPESTGRRRRRRGGSPVCGRRATAAAGSVAAVLRRPAGAVIGTWTGPDWRRRAAAAGRAVRATDQATGPARPVRRAKARRRAQAEPRCSASGLSGRSQTPRSLLGPSRRCRPPRAD